MSAIMTKGKYKIKNTFNRKNPIVKKQSEFKKYNKAYNLLYNRAN